MEWTASHAELKEKLSTLDKQITIVHKSSFLKSKPAIQGENKTNEYLLYVENLNFSFLSQDTKRPRNMNKLDFFNIKLHLELLQNS